MKVKVKGVVKVSYYVTVDDVFEVPDPDEATMDAIRSEQVCAGNAHYSEREWVSVETDPDTLEQ